MGTTLGTLAGTCVGYLVQADHDPTPEGRVAPLSAAQDGQVATDGDLRKLLTDHGLRHVAARGWTTADGTRTRIHLLQFGNGGGRRRAVRVPRPVRPTGVRPQRRRRDDARRGPPGLGRARPDHPLAYDEAEPYGPEQVRQAYVQAGDVIGLVVQSREGTAAAVPFQQTVTLQSELPA
ncbi:hypothetical protein AQJ30_17610 [Streptomyces longwoodensis]|uniref:Uncharacterized protein n=1 Tax=Streptomyces longwoodensis TaxID=68231 RepID=A0A117QN38_9ACTN|nr:hypothetical protein [Streptomyces longwoodensis]KUN37469.1 hypothetical protein AQJ30_17610 [Streptomyces longwoodensis]